MRRTCVLLVVTAVACKSSEYQPPKQTEKTEVRTADAMPIDALVAPKLTKCEEFAHGMCAAFARCMPHAWFAKWNESKNCEEQLGHECKGWAVAGTNLTDDMLATCSSAVTEMKCADFHGWDTPACEPAWRHGTLADGKPCMLSYQCASGSCETDYKADCRKCVHRDERPHEPRVPGREVGVGCKSDGDCADGLACDKKKCTPPRLAGDGEACTKSFMGPAGLHPCKYGWACVEDDKTKKSSCKRMLQPGEACKRFKEPGCQFPLACVDDTCQDAKPEVCKS
jgi:hypothetical protein